MSLLSARQKARHAKPSRTGPVLAAGGLTAAFVAVDGAALASAAQAASSEANWDRLAVCESNGNWSINTGNGYYGGLQFNLATWRSVGGTGYPHQASRAEQIARANRLHDARGFQPWPACSRKLGLTGGGGAATTAATTAAKAAPPAAKAAPKAATRQAAAKATRSRVTTGGKAPAFPGTLSTARRGYDPNVKVWQQRMRDRGWKITVDGYFGPQSASVAQRFAAEKGLRATPGTVNAAVWTGSWTLSTR